MTLLARRSDLSGEQFARYWLENHAGIVRRMPAVGGYVQNLVAERLLRPANAANPFGFDGIVELWFADAEAQKTAFASPAAAELPPDEPNFIRGITIYAVEAEVMEGSGQAVKVLMVARAGREPSQGAAREGIVAGVTASPLRRHLAVVNRLGPAGSRAGIWHEPDPPDLVLEFGFEDRAALDAFAASADLAALHRAVTAAGGALECYRVEPRRII